MLSICHNPDVHQFKEYLLAMFRNQCQKRPIVYRRDQNEEEDWKYVKNEPVPETYNFQELSGGEESEFKTGLPTTSSRGSYRYTMQCELLHTHTHCMPCHPLTLVTIAAGRLYRGRREHAAADT